MWNQWVDLVLRLHTWYWNGYQEIQVSALQTYFKILYYYKFAALSEFQDSCVVCALVNLGLLAYWITKPMWRWWFGRDCQYTFLIQEWNAGVMIRTIVTTYGKNLCQSTKVKEIASLSQPLIPIPYAPVTGTLRPILTYKFTVQINFDSLCVSLPNCFTDLFGKK